MPVVRLSIRPDEEVEVPDREALDLRRKGFLAPPLVESPAPDTAPAGTDTPPTSPRRRPAPRANTEEA